MRPRFGKPYRHRRSAGGARPLLTSDQADGEHGNEKPQFGIGHSTLVLRASGRSSTPSIGSGTRIGRRIDRCLEISDSRSSDARFVIADFPAPRTKAAPQTDPAALRPREQFQSPRSRMEDRPCNGWRSPSAARLRSRFRQAAQFASSQNTSCGGPPFCPYHRHAGADFRCKSLTKCKHWRPAFQCDTVALDAGIPRNASPAAAIAWRCSLLDDPRMV